MKEIKVLGTGCAKCRKLEELTREAAGEIDLECEIEKVEDIQKIMSYGVMMTPALVVDGKVVATGKVPSVSELKKMLIK
jgi:small redox-active disulfide protein 2